MKSNPVHEYLAGIGRRGGLSTSKAKVAAARRNGCKGGRPSNPCLGCSGFGSCPFTDKSCGHWICARQAGKRLVDFDKRFAYNERSESKAVSAKRPSKKKKP